LQLITLLAQLGRLPGFRNYVSGIIIRQLGFVRLSQPGTSPTIIFKNTAHFKEFLFTL
jgi:hypothetical protein